MTILNPDSAAGVLLEVSNLGTELILRIDRDPIGRLPSGAEAVLELHFLGTDPSDEQLNRLQKGIGEHIDWEVYDDDADREVAIYLNYKPDPRVTLSISGLKEEAAIYKPEDMWRRCSLLGKAFTSEYHRAYRAENRHNKFVERFFFEIDRQIDREDRKAEGFRVSNPARSKQYVRSGDAYRAVRKLAVRLLSADEPTDGDPGIESDSD